MFTFIQITSALHEKPEQNKNILLPILWCTQNKQPLKHFSPEKFKASISTGKC